MQPEKVDAGWAKRPPVSSPQAQTQKTKSAERSSTEKSKPKLDERERNPVVVKNEDECNPSLRSGSVENVAKLIFLTFLVF